MKLFEVRNISYSLPNFDYEWEEASRYLPLYRLGKDVWLDISKNGKEVSASSLLDIGNIDLEIDNLDPNKVIRAKNALDRNNIELPIVIKIKGKNDLLSGNTRFAYLKSKGISPNVWFIDVDKELEALKELDEGALKKAAIAGTLGLAALSNFPEYNIKDMFKKHIPSILKREKHVDPKEEEIRALADKITSKYKHVKPEFALQVARLAKQHEKPVFPKADDILSIVGIESSFRPDAVSKLKKDPAVGLTQIRPGVWGFEPNKLKGDINTQISAAADILDQYNQRLKNPEDAVHAYNVGIGNFRKGKHNPNYVMKFNREKQLYNENP